MKPPEAQIQADPGSSSGTSFDFRISVFFLILVTVAVYCPVANQEFTNWDDPKHMQAIWKPGWERAWKIVTDFDLHYTQVTYYSPVYFLSLMADQAAIGAEHKAQAWIAKVMNVVYHVVNTLLVFAMFSMMGIGRRGAFIGAMLFAVHPAQVGTVAWITERKNVLAALFYLAGMMAFLRYSRTSRWAYVPLVLVLFSLGLLSKPAVVTLPVVIVAWILIVQQQKPQARASYFLIASLFVMALAWGVYAVSTEVSYEGMLPPLLYRPLLASGALWFYLSTFVYPHPLVVVYPRWDVVSHSIRFIILLVALGAVAGLITYYRKRIDPLIVWGLAWFVINVLPVAGLLPFGHMGHSFVADHFLYLPMVGLCLAVARVLELALHGLEDRTTIKNVVVVGAYGVICLFGVLAVKQTWLWRDAASLWEATLKINTTSPAVYNNYGWICMSRGELHKAMKLFKRASELAPGLDAPYQNMGRIYRTWGETEEARAMFKKAWSLNPKANFPRIMLATMLREEGKYDQAIAFLRKCLDETPDSSLLWTELALTNRAAGHTEDAIKQLDRAIKADPLSPAAYVHKAMILLSMKEPDKAVELLKMSISLGAGAEAYNLLGATYATKGDLPRALIEFLRAYRANPNLSGIRDNVANALIKMNQLERAREFCIQGGRSGRPCSDKILRKLAHRLGNGG